MEWMILPLRRYAQFSGRSQRKEYWMFFLFNILGSTVLSILDSALGLGGHSNDYASQGANGFAAGFYTRGGLLSSLWSLAIMLPSISVGVRRMHDIDRSGWWLLSPLAPAAAGVAFIFFAPIVGALFFGVTGILFILLLVWACMDGTHGANRFGPDPKGMTADLAETFG